VARDSPHPSRAPGFRRLPSLGRTFLLASTARAVLHCAVMAREKRLPGRASLFRRKVRAPVSITLTHEHHRLVDSAAERLGLTRSDFLGLLIHLYADSVEPQDVADLRSEEE